MRYDVDQSLVSTESAFDVIRTLFPTLLCEVSVLSIVVRNLGQQFC